MGIVSSIKNLFGDNQTVVIDANDEEAIKQWLTERLATHLKRDINDISSSVPFEEYGLDSMFAVRVTGELEKAVELRLSPALFFENACIDEVAKEIASSTMQV